VRGLAGAVVAAGACILASAWVGGLTSACELTLPGDDGGAGTGSTTDVAAQTQTQGLQCTRIVTEFCTQAINRCGLGVVGAFNLDDCIKNDTHQCACMASGTCSDVSSASSSDVATCTQAIDSEDCNSIALSTSPTECAIFVGADQ
jgi:hypothetical protein